MPNTKPPSQGFLDSLNNIECDDLAPVSKRKSSSNEKLMFFGRLLIVLILAVAFVASGIHVTSSFIDLTFNYQDWEDLLRSGIPSLGGGLIQAPSIPNFDGMLLGEDIPEPPPQEEADRFLLNRQRIQSATHQNRNTPGTIIGIIAIYSRCRTRTLVNYPVVQGSDNVYYLNHLLDGTRSAVGAIFLDYRATQDPRTPLQNFVIYGHNIGIQGARKFAHLHRIYNTQRGFSDYPYVVIYTMTGIYEYTIFGAARVHESGGHNHVCFNNNRHNALHYVEGLRYIQDNSRWRRSGITLNENSRLLSLSTCTNGPSHERLHIAAVMTNWTHFG